MKLVLRALWSTKWWIAAWLAAEWNVINVVLNAGYFNVTVKSGAVEYHYYYYLGFTSGTAGLLAGLILGVLYSKAKAYLVAHRVHPADRGDLFNDPHPPVSPGTSNAYTEITKYE